MNMLRFATTTPWTIIKNVLKFGFLSERIENNSETIN